MQTTQEVSGAAQALPRWIDLAHGVRVFVRPMTAELEADARHLANTKVREALRAPSVIAVMGDEEALADLMVRTFGFENAQLSVRNAQFSLRHSILSI